jgi:chromosome segregation ATPase
MSDSPVLAALARLEAGQSRIEAGQTGFDAMFAKLETGFAGLEAGLAGLEASQKSLRSEFPAELGKTRADIMERVDRLQHAVTLIRDDVAVNMGAVEASSRVNENTRADLRTLGEQVSVMWKQLKQLQSEMREVRGDP